MKQMQQQLVFNELFKKLPDFKANEKKSVLEELRALGQIHCG